ncbi:MAG: hypothetical protein HRU18_02900 [Pseudoalteromonas sp.]|uniref:hypothetical protein n=1 Tax=Pseudoalteromonas sp. TaxID=53249 RepID=UPI001D76310B|nr:hypothetical protein [Pseudoalteromonas sp.]NRA77133.1 hypothetical protein [Pseudoalteromonas sp.]
MSEKSHMTKLENMIMAGFITGSFTMGGAVLYTVSSNQVELAANGVASQEIIKDIQELRLEVSNYDSRIDVLEIKYGQFKYMLDMYHERMDEHFKDVKVTIE